MRDCLVAFSIATVLGLGIGISVVSGCPYPQISSQLHFPSETASRPSKDNTTMRSVKQSCELIATSGSAQFSAFTCPDMQFGAVSDPSVIPSAKPVRKLGAAMKDKTFFSGAQRQSKDFFEGQSLQVSEIEDLAEIAWSVEVVWCILVISVALWFGFRLGARSAPRLPRHASTLSLDFQKPFETQASTTGQSPETIQDEDEEFCQKEGFSLNSCPTPSVCGVLDDAEDLCVASDDSALHIENGRLRSTFSDVTEIWRDCLCKFYTGIHVLEGKKYVIKEIALPASSQIDVTQHQAFQDIQTKAKCGSKYVIRYITCWLEEIDSNSAVQSRVRVFVQIEFFSLTPLTEFLRGCRPTRSDVCLIFRQILKGVCHLHKENLCFYDLSPSSIYIDCAMNVKIADFELTPSIKTCRSLTFDRFEDEEIDSPTQLWHKRNMRSLGLLLFQLMGGGRESMRDLIEDNALAEDFVSENEMESKIIMWLMRQNGQRPEAEEVLRSRKFNQWSEAVGLNSTLNRAGASPLLPIPSISLTKIA